MDAYIDFSNFCSYLSSMNSRDFERCNETLLSNFNLHFTFDKKEMLKAQKGVKRKFDQWLRTATKNRKGKNNDWSVAFPPRPVTANTHLSFNKEQLSSIYMIDGEGVDKWANTGCLLIAQKGKELDVIKNLQIEESFNPTRLIRIRDLSNWSIFGQNSSPCTDIILVDQYIFAQSDYEYDINSYALIEQLCKWSKGAAVNIVIFTLKSYPCGDRVSQIPFKTIKRCLGEKLKEKTGVNPNITFIMLPGRTQHDRTILTNYKMYTSGDSFKYFRDGENVSLCTKGEWLYINSLYDPTNLENAQKFVEDLQVIIDNVKDNFSIEGDKKSFYLKF